MRQILDRVTVTGADDSVAPATLGVLSDVYPRTEWGILVSENQTIIEGGTPRFPSMEWLQALHSEACRRELQLSLHLCGRWVRELCKGSWGPLIGALGSIMDVFQRVQLNFHGYVHKLVPKEFFKSLRLLDGQFNESKQYIFQLDGVNDWIASNACGEGLDVSVLYDRSGGAGKLPEEWTAPMAGIYTGYAGGLGSENVTEQLEKLEQLVGDEPTWIDAETRVRTDEKFDQDKVSQFLWEASPWVKVVGL
jgi:hypothetical protein